MTVTPKLLERMATNRLTIKFSFKDDGKNLRNGTLELRIDDSAGQSKEVIINLKRKKFGSAKGKHRIKTNVAVSDVDWIKISGWLRDAGGKVSTPKRVKIEVAAADDDGGDGNPPPPWGIEVGNRALDFTLRDQNRQDISLHDCWGSVILVDFTTMWCTPCREEAADAEQLYQMFKNNGFMLLTVLIEDDNGDPVDLYDCQEWARRYGLTFPVLADSDKDAWRIYAGEGYVPKNVFIDRNMVIRHVIIGYNSRSKENFENIISGLLSEPPQAPR